ncbi:MAG: cysteine desulfurase, partial [Acholeplasma sp.]|nr:cysteine desulfurase [Acholeplasma sp.]
FINDGDEIITSELEHHSSFLPWQEIANEKNAKLVFIPLNKGRITVDGFKKVITNKTKVVAITYVSNVLGYKTPIKEITKLAHEVGAIVILDAAQAVSHIKIDVKDMDVDFLAFSAHKMYGPNGVGVLYGKKALLEKLPPFEYGGEMVHTVSKDKSTWKDIPYKFEAGTPVIGEVIAFSEAIDFINEIGIDNICKQEMELKDYTVSKLKTIQGVKVYNPDADNPIIAFNIDNVHPHDVTSVLDQNNVCIRAGHHCAQLAIKYLNEIATLRASFGVYNTLEDCDKFLEAVKMASDFFKKF